tara:strand:+ start:7049 stop:7777 length:729 start_codon:yes stop_codon:yes gene_type:complete
VSQRLDQEMLQRELVLTRSQARMLIKQGDVSCDGKVITKPGQLVEKNTKISIKSDQLYVSRGAFKLKAAIQNFNLDFNGLIVADCGASTGGFTQVLLESGASKVYALDVGHDQLSPILTQDQRVISREGVNLKFEIELDEKVDACVADLSFISLKLVIPTMLSFLKDDGFLVLLLKPQFEAGKERVGKGGLVPEKYLKTIREELFEYFREKDLKLIDWTDSPIKGKKGNTEYLVYLKRDFVA